MCDTDLTLAESRKSCRNARVTLVLDLRDVFLKQTLLGSLVMSRVTSLSFGLALELVTGK
jgi:hypothetical protein